MQGFPLLLSTQFVRRGLSEHAGHRFRQTCQPANPRCLSFLATPVLGSLMHKPLVWLLCGCWRSHPGLQACTACILLAESPPPLAPVFTFLKRTLTCVFISAVNSALGKHYAVTTLTNPVAVLSLALCPVTFQAPSTLLRECPSSFCTQHRCDISRFLILLLNLLLFSAFISYH